jgi:hypothetical protein
MITDWKTLVTSYLVHIDHVNAGPYYVASVTKEGWGVLNHPTFGVVHVSPDQIQHFKVKYNPNELLARVASLEKENHDLRVQLANIGQQVILQGDQTVRDAARTAHKAGYEIKFSTTPISKRKKAKAFGKRKSKAGRPKGS